MPSGRAIKSLNASRLMRGAFHLYID